MALHSAISMQAYRELKTLMWTWKDSEMLMTLNVDNACSVSKLVVTSNYYNLHDVVNCCRTLSIMASAPDLLPA